MEPSMLKQDAAAIQVLLQELLATARADTASNLAWWYKTEALVRAVWSMESPQYHAYREIPLLSIYSGMVPGTFGDKELASAKVTAESYLEGLIFEVSHFGLGDAKAGGA